MDIDAFIDKWSRARGGAERANYQMFLSEFCQAIGVPSPDPASHQTAANDYVFERGVQRRPSEGMASTLRIDLYKRGCFILEAKQSRATQRDDQPVLFKEAETASTAASEGRWDVLMRNARKQAEDYVFRLPPDHVAPPFIIVCDVGYVFEVYADFSGSGRAYTHFPDRKGFRIRLEDLRDEKVVDRLRAIWTAPQTLDPAREAARVTRGIAERLAEVSKRLEKKHPAEEVAHFLMRCIFTMFAEDVDLLPKGKFTALLKERLDSPDSFAPMLTALWKSMDAADYESRFYAGFGTYLKHFNGSLFTNAKAFPLGREEIGELLAAASHDWRYVEPAIFGTLVEQALEPGERRKLGAHYTPRSYVERLVQVTVMEPLRADWDAVRIKIGDALERGEPAEAVAAVRAFHHQLCTTRVLDPACGTGNFLYVSLELMKRLEGEVLEALAELGETEGIGLETVDPHQFLGIELNVRAAAIAELVLWIGYLQQHYRNRSEHPAEPILKAFGNIQQKDAVLTWDGYPELQFEMRNGVAVQVYPNARRPEWPEAEFIVGNPPFLGKGAGMRRPLGDSYVDALWSAHDHLPESIDFVMYWWDRAADLLTRKSAPLRRFGLVTTNSISQAFNRKVIEFRQAKKNPVSLVFAVADHPWTKATRDAAAVRIAMTVGVAGKRDGRALIVVRESHLESDTPRIEVTSREGKIHSDLSIGPDVTQANKLLSNAGICANGMMLSGAGFVVTETEAKHLGLDRREGLRDLIKPYIKGKALYDGWRRQFVVDLFDLPEAQVRTNFPEIYQMLLERVKPERIGNIKAYRERAWWLFGENNPKYRTALRGLRRYIATVETAKHRLFRFVDGTFVHDHMVVGIASDDALHLSLLSSRPHLQWTLMSGGTLEDRPRYNKSRCFDPFPFPDPDEATRARLRALGEELDATRKTVQADHPDLTLTGLYNVLEKVRAGTPLDTRDEDVKDRGRVLILKDLHDQIDRATMQAYGWDDLLSPLPLGEGLSAREREARSAARKGEGRVPEGGSAASTTDPHPALRATFSQREKEGRLDEIILERLVALNAERAAEEAAGHVRWLRPDYQIPRFAKGAAAPKSGELDLGSNVVALDKGLPAFPKDKGDQVMAIRAVLVSSGRPMDAAAVARAFKGGGKKIEQRVVQALATLVRYAEITPLPDGTYAAKRAA